MFDQSGEGATERSGVEERELVEVFSVNCVQGPSAGQAISIQASAPRALIGKSPVCNLRLDDPEVSRRHASLRMTRGAAVLLDLGSTNGTSVNGVAIREVFLRGGETVTIGSSVLTITRGEPSFLTLSQETSFGRVLGQSQIMRALYPVLQNAAERDFPLLLEGETGVGKRLVANELHARSARASKPFVVVECQAIERSELERRVFDEAGFLDEADGGTVYFDEASALPSAVQTRLVADLAPKGVRLIFGTKVDLDREVAEKRFREDLLSSIAKARIELPPLRDREGDVSFLAKSFWSQMAKDATFEVSAQLPTDFVHRFPHYAWPGNIPELLQAVSTRFCLGELAKSPLKMNKAAEAAFSDILAQNLQLADARSLVVQEFERRYVDHLMTRFDSTKEAAAAAGIAQRYLQILRARQR